MVCNEWKNNIKKGKEKLLNFDVKLMVSLKTPRDGILGHQFDKRLESFAPCYSQSLLLADLKKAILFSSPEYESRLKMAFKSSISS
jgi:hypothetical protein